MNKLPSDPVILFSWINTQLRDFYPSFDELCSSLDLDRKELETKLSDAGFVYQPETNQFR